MNVVVIRELKFNCFTKKYNFSKIVLLKSNKKNKSLFFTKVPNYCYLFTFLNITFSFLIKLLSTVQSPCKEANWLWQFASSFRLMWSCSHFIDSWRNMIQLHFKSSQCFCILIPAVGCTSTCPANIHVCPTRVSNAGWSLALCLVWTHREAEARRPVEKTNFGHLHLWPFAL